MKKTIALAGAFAIGAAVGGVSIELVHAQASRYETRQVMAADLNNLPGQEVMIFASTWQPGFRLPLHMHPNGHEITYVVEGSRLSRSTAWERKS